MARAEALFPDEIAAARRTAAEQARALTALEGRLAPTPSTSLHPGAHRAASFPAPANTQPWMPGQVRHGAEGDVPLHYWPLARLAVAFADGTLDAVTLLNAHLSRIASIDGQLNSFVAIDRDGAFAAAHESTARWKAGAALGPLDGVPVGIKDVIDVARLPTRCHSRVTDPAPVVADAAIVGRLRAAGAVIIGKLATHEFAIGGPAFDLAWPPARNPWNLDHHPGGSSSGAGVAIAAGLVPLAIGTDTAGSVRNPASACGVVGLKPGLGVLPIDGVVPLAPSLDHVGLLTRDIADMMIAAKTLGIELAPARRGRVGYVRHFHTRDMIATAEVAAALDGVAAALNAAEVTLPSLGHFALVNRVILQAEGFAAHARHLQERSDELSRLTRTALLPGAFVGAETLAAATRARAALTRAVEAAFGNNDILLTASSMELPCRIDDPAEVARTYMLQARGPFNVTGHPALTLPAGMAESGLPLSVQLVARRKEEGRLLATAAVVERLFGEKVFPPI